MGRITTPRDINDVEVFVRVVESGSFTAAGRLLGIPKSSVSRKVSRLETHLGVRLLHRTTRSLALTAAGRTYFDRVSRIIADLDDIDSTVAGLGQTPRGPLRITVPLSFEETGHEVYFGFLERYPEIRLEVAVTDRYVDLVQEGFDLAVRGGKPPDPSLTGVKILDSRMELLASTRYLEEHGRPTCASDLKQHECLIHGLKSPEVWQFETTRGPTEVTVHGRFASTNLHALIKAARLGLGITRLPTGSQPVDTSGLEVVLPDLALAGGGLWLVYQSHKQMSPALRVFIEFVQDHFAAQASG